MNVLPYLINRYNHILKTIWQANGIFATSTEYAKGYDCRRIGILWTVSIPNVVENTAKEDREIVDYALHITKTNHLREQLIPFLSGGERQRVWIAMALAQQPKLLVLDEPTTYLDINHQLEIMELLKRLNKEQDLTVLMVLHELTQAVQYSHYMAVIKEGHLVVSGETSKIISDELFRDVFSVDVQLDTFDNKKYVRVKGLVE